ncbi:MAG: hypothetical protein WAV31_03150 [Candidatus Moraniibacteriota bacterium]
MTNDKKNLNSTEIKTTNADRTKAKKDPTEQRSEKLDKINHSLSSFNAQNNQNIEEVESTRKREFESKLDQLGIAEIPVSEETKKLIRQNMVSDTIDHAKKENERFDRLKIDKIILENIDQPDSQLIKRLFAKNDAEISEDVFHKSLEKLSKTNIKLEPRERIEIFREALEYFSREEKVIYPVGHATGSDSLRMIIKDGSIKEGGTGEHGEAAGQSRGGKQQGVSVAEMNHEMADYVEIFYARMAANREITKEALEIDADIIDGKNPIEDFIEIYVEFTDTDKLLGSMANRSDNDIDSIKLKIAQEIGKKPREITHEDIKKSKILEEILFGFIKKAAGRKHYMTAERASRDYVAFDSIIKNCEKCKNGEFPEITFNGKIYKDPDEIINLKHGIYELEDDDLPEKKILIEMQNEYAYFLRPYFDQESGEWMEPRYSISEFRSRSSEILGEYAKWIKEGETFKTLTMLHPLESDSEDVKRKKIARLKELDNQFPSILVIEADEYKKNGLTHTEKEGSRPVPFFEVEERIMSDISLSNIKEIIIPRSKIDEIKKWLTESGIKENNMPRMVAFEYFEIKRLLNHQLKELTRKIQA